MTRLPSQPATDPLWQPQPAAAGWVRETLDGLIQAHPGILLLQQRLRDDTGTRLFDWLDHLGLPLGADQRTTLRSRGFQPELPAPDGSPADDRPPAWQHPAAVLPRVVDLPSRETPRVALKVESVDDFLAAHAGTRVVSVVGEPDGPLRCACVSRADDCELWIVERHGDRGFQPPRVGAAKVAAAVHYRRLFKRRPREFPRDDEGFETTQKTIELAVGELGAAWACDLFFQAERKYWQSRNQAARVQYQRQKRLGLGWANHDHHTYRSSRDCFHRLIRCLESMGFVCRERFYAGREAGWGAQVLEQPDCGIVVFADVDLAPDEISGDIAHQPLPPASHLSTVGLWCRLHGEAFLRAGLHHLECQFDFDAAREQLAQLGVATMAPFTELPFLRQAFTQGERWRVASRRLEKALRTGGITPEQAQRFRVEGAIGSHLEILERNEGYKGFNQTGISEIISRTDPRQTVEGSPNPLPLKDLR